MVGSSNGKTPRKTRQASFAVNGSPNRVPESNGSSDCDSIQFTREVVDALLNEKMKANKYSFKDRCDQMMDYIKKLRLCIKWFQQLEGNYVIEHEQLLTKSELAERKCTEIEILMTNKEEELNSIILELKESYIYAQKKSIKEESDKLVAMNSLEKEKDARITAESLQASLTEELSKVQRDLQNVSQKLISLNDTYTKLNEYNTSLQQFNCKIQTELAQVNEVLKCVEEERSVAVENLDTLRNHHSVIQDELTSTKTLQRDSIKHNEALVSEVGSLKRELQDVKHDRDELHLRVESLIKEVVKYKDSIGKTCTMLDGLTLKSNELEAKCLSQSEQIRTLQDKLESAENKLQKSDVSVMETKTEAQEQKKIIHFLENHLAVAEFKLIEGEKLRKKLHNTILELKGNIRVFCRVRPLLPDENGNIEAKFISYPTSTETLGRAIDISQNGQKHSFTFDRVFSPNASQEEVFVEISQLVQSALDGYKVCIFAYGQTGSGKTYTMMGKPGLADLKGLIPRSLEQIFLMKESLESQGWKYEMQMSMLEIYNETIRDLLWTNRSSSIENCASGKQYTIKHDADGNTVVSDLTIIDVQSPKEVSFLLHRAAQSRSVGKTQINEESSRSHCVFILKIFGVNESMEQRVQGVLNLIDLAGSERLSKSGSTGDRLKETQAINKSLSALSDVIFALAKKDDHVPFRNSKLTYLLQPCLGGDSKTLMFVNIAPNCSSLGETICSLRFAARVNACEIGIPRRQASNNIATRLSYG